jgi:hypothetical protein
MSNNYRLARIDAKTKTITDIADLSEEKDTQMNIKQKRIKTELRDNWVYHSPCCRSFLFERCYQGLVMEAEKRKKNNKKTIRIEKGNPKKRY